MSIAVRYRFHREHNDMRTLRNCYSTFICICVFIGAGGAQTLQTNFLIKGEPTELSALSNGATINPTINTTGLPGTLVVTGGSVNFAPAATGNGVYFLNCCDSTNTHYKFSGVSVGSVFNIAQGQVSFYLKSRAGFAQRKTSAGRIAFDVRDDDPNNHLFYFLTAANTGNLVFTYVVGGSTQFYYVPAGTEDTLFGNGVILKITLRWNGAATSLYLNDNLVQTVNDAKRSPNWTANSIFDLGAFEYVTYGAYNACDDIIDEFTLSGPAVAAAPPTITFQSPGNGTTISGSTSISANVSSNALSSVQFQVDNNNLGAPFTTGGPLFTATLDTTTLANGPHTITVVAKDQSGSTVSSSISVTVSNNSSWTIGNRVQTNGSIIVYSAPGGTQIATRTAAMVGTLIGGPTSSGGSTWWNVAYDDGVSGWSTSNSLLAFPTLNLSPNAWTLVQPTYTGASDGVLFPQGWGNKGAYDPLTHRVIISDRWSDALHGSSIFANGIHAYDPYANVFTVLKLNSWYVQPVTCSDGTTGCYQTTPLPANQTDPTPPDHHPWASYEVVPPQNAVYTVNGINSISLPDQSILNRTWRFDLASKSWTMVSSDQTDPNFPPNNGGADSGLIYDPASGQLVYFAPTACGCNGTATYLFNVSTNTWTAVPQDQSSLSVYTASAGIAYDTKRQRILTFGGNNFISSPATPNLWAYSVASNTWTRLADAPVAAMAPSFAYDSKHDIFLALVFNNTYIYDPNSNTWSQYPATLNRPPTLNLDQAVTYDPAYDVFLFQGGTFDSPMFALFRYDPNTPPVLNIDTHAPTVSITAPADGSTVSGIVNLTANATDTIIPNTTDQIGVVAVQFLLNGQNLGAIIPGAGPGFSLSWDTTGKPSGTYTVSAVAYDEVGNIGTSSISVNIANTGAPPVIATVAATAITSSTATVAWTTDILSDSHVAYGTTTSYGAVNGQATLVTSHSVVLSSLSPSTTYHFQVSSRDGQGDLATSLDFTFTTSSAVPPLLQIHADAGEVSGTTSGSTVTPGIAPAGFTGKVVVNKTGSVNYAPATVGNGVYFQNCCDNTNAYYKFTGSTVGSIFNVNQGSITFYLKSRYSFAQRQSTAAAARAAFDVRDDDLNNHVFYFYTTANTGNLVFTYAAGGGAQFYYAPVGTEDTLFGNGVTLKVTITWDGSTSKLLLNDNQVQSSSYSKGSPNWTANSVFDLGAYEYVNLGGYNASDDIIDEFTVIGAPIGADTTVPNVAITAPAPNATVNGTVTVTANAIDNNGMSKVQFQLDGVSLGNPVNGTGPSYSISWNTTSAADGNHMLTAVATDTSGNFITSSGIAVNVQNSANPPAISAVNASSTATGATITWTTDTASTSQVAYGLTGSYGSLTTLNNTLVTSHTVSLSGLTASTTYHYKVMSQDSQGRLSSSSDFTFATTAASSGPQPLLQIHADAGEVSGTTNGSNVTPGIAPAGFTGKVVVNKTGSVNYTPATVGNGVYFLNCCDNVNAYYKFTGSTVGSIFNVNQGSITFYLKSRYSFSQRKSTAAAARAAFDVRDDDMNNHVFYFLTTANTGNLVFTYAVGGGAQFYYAPAGTEDTLFGNGVTVKVTITWDGSTSKLFLNDNQVQSSSYSKGSPNWTANSVFDLGAYEYVNLGGYNASDDIIDEFTVVGPAIGPDTTLPAVAITAPAPSATVNGTVTVTANATDNIAMSNVQFQLDGASLGNPVAGAGPSYSISWDTTPLANGNHTLTAVATDTSGNFTISSGIVVSVQNSTNPPAISAVNAVPTATGATITWTTDTASTSQVAYGLTSSYGSLTTPNNTLATSHTVSLSGLTASTPHHYQVMSQDAQGRSSTSADFTFTTTSASGPQPLLQIHADAGEVSGTTNGSTVTPGIAPAGFTGKVVVTKTGSVNYAPATVGNGVYFQNCCDNTNAYYKFTGPTVGSIFNVNQGSITFYLKSRYSFSQRRSTAAAARAVFDVRDDNMNNHLFYFFTSANTGNLVFTYAVGGAAQFYYAPAGTEDALFGNGVTVKVTITWDGSTSKLFLNDNQVQSSSYSKGSPNWTVNSVFDFGAYEYVNLGGYNASDDIIDEFTVLSK